MSFLQKLNIKVDKALLLAFLALGMVVLLLEVLSPDRGISPESETVTENVDVDTMIPAGHLLIPLELSNSESLASLSGAFSVVDLYAASERGKKGFKLASGVKLVRAPLNPEQFAVLVREEDSGKIVGHEGPFFAALKNPKEPTIKETQRKVSQPSLIIHYGE